MALRQALGAGIPLVYNLCRPLGQLLIRGKRAGPGYLLTGKDSPPVASPGLMEKGEAENHQEAIKGEQDP